MSDNVVKFPGQDPREEAPKTRTTEQKEPSGESAVVEAIRKEKEERALREQKREKRAKTRKAVVRFVTAVLTLLLVLGGLILVIFRDEVNLDSLKRYLTYQSLERDESGQAEEIFFENNSSNCFAQLEDNLIVCSTTNLALYSQSGTEYVSETVIFQNPAIDVAGAYGVAYDLGGKVFYVFEGKSILWSGEAEGEILAAHVNKNGYLTIVNEAVGYKGVTTVYNADGGPVVIERISSAYVMDAQVSDNGKTLALVTIGESGGTFVSNVGFYSTSTGELLTSWPLEDQLTLALSWDSDGLWVQTDRGVSYVTQKDGVTGSYVSDSGYLRGFSNGGNGYQAMVFSIYQTGNRGSIVLADKKGNRLATVPVAEEVLSISASGNYVAVLYTNRLEIYNDDLELYGYLEDTAGARQVMMRSDGTALLIGSTSASLYLP